MHSLKLKLEIFQLLRKSLATCSEFERFSVNSSDPGLSNTAGSGSGFPVKTTCLQLLQFITKAAQENDETLRRTFFYAAEGKIKPFSHRLQAAFSEAKNFGFLNDLPIFPFFPLQSWSKFDEKMHDETLNFDFFFDDNSSLCRTLLEFCCAMCCCRSTGMQYDHRHSAQSGRHAEFSELCQYFQLHW